MANLSMFFKMQIFVMRLLAFQKNIFPYLNLPFQVYKCYEAFSHLKKQFQLAGVPNRNFTALTQTAAKTQSQGLLLLSNEEVAVL